MLYYNSIDMAYLYREVLNKSIRIEGGNLTPERWETCLGSVSSIRKCQMRDGESTDVGSKRYGGKKNRHIQRETCQG